MVAAWHGTLKHEFPKYRNAIRWNDVTLSSLIPRVTFYNITMQIPVQTWFSCRWVTRAESLKAAGFWKWSHLQFAVRCKAWVLLHVQQTCNAIVPWTLGASWYSCSVELLVNRSSERSCTRGMIHNKFISLPPGCPRPSIALQCRIVA